MYRYIRLTLLCSALVLPIAAWPQDRDERRDNPQASARYEDRAHHDSHDWNDKEDQAYKHYVKENHKKSREFTKLKQRDQQNYWNWRHSHPDEDRR